MTEQINEIMNSLLERSANVEDSGEVLSKYEQKEIERQIRESNSSANVPMRFSKAMFSDHQNPLSVEFENFVLQPDDKVFILMGGVGVGKTTLLASGIHSRAAKGINPGFYMSMRNLPALVRSSRSFAAKENEYELIQRLSMVSMLFVDELGASDDIQLESNYIRLLIANRFDNALPTAIATNLAWDKLKEFLSRKDQQGEDAILDRLREISIRRGINGESHRGEK